MTPSKQLLRLLAAGFTVAVLLIPSGVVAETHVVSGDDLQKEVVAASQARQYNLDTVREFVSSERAQKAMKVASINAEQVKTAVSMLSNEELAQLASRANQAQADFAAGTLSERDLILIILGIVALVLIIVAVR